MAPAAVRLPVSDPHPLEGADHKRASPAHLIPSAPLQPPDQNVHKKAVGDQDDVFIILLQKIDQFIRAPDGVGPGLLLALPPQPLEPAGRVINPFRPTAF